MNVYNYLLLFVPIVGAAMVLAAMRWMKDSKPSNRLHPGE
jgi:hypothetical protein